MRVDDSWMGSLCGKAGGGLRLLLADFGEIGFECDQVEVDWGVGREWSEKAFGIERAWWV